MDTKQTPQENSGSAEAHYNLGNNLYSRGDLDTAIISYKQALTIKPDYVDAMHNLGIVLAEQGNLSGAVKCFQQEIALEPNLPDSHFNLGNTLKKQGNISGAVTCYQNAIKIEPDYVDAHYNLGNTFKESGSLDLAVECYQKVHSIKPDDAYILYNLGNTHKELGKLNAAVASYQKAISLKPDYLDVYNSLGAILNEQGKLLEAALCYEKSISLKPDDADIHYNLGNVRKDQGLWNAAVLSYQKAITIKPTFPEALGNLGSMLKNQGKVDAAISCYQKALSIDPNHVESHYNLGNAMKEQGKFAAALASYKTVISLKPDYAEAYLAIATTKKHTDISEIENLKQILLNESSTDKKIALNFALGKAEEDLQQYSSAFQYYLAGNNSKRAALQFNMADEYEKFRLFRTIFNAEFFRSRRGFGATDQTPIFILGMPRSGSTLIEQILSSHPDVYGAGELIFAALHILENMPSNLIGMIPDTVVRFKADDFNKLGNKYIKRIREIEPETKFITDKMPINFLFIGIIRLMLPNAKIIHSVRSPEDTCLSIFRTKFTELHGYAYNLAELGEYYRLYSEMMSHWHNVFPDTIYDVHYEKLTENQEKETRRLLEFCGLDWNDNCLNFHKTVKNVRTASNYQVRQPMYRSSVGGWKRFEKQLQPLIEALGDLASDPTLSPR